ncbi:MAG: hypothetical protein ACK5PS_10925 [Desulfopila sp.]
MLVYPKIADKESLALPRDFHGLFVAAVPGPAMVVYPKLISTENAVTAPRSFMVRCG